MRSMQDFIDFVRKLYGKDGFIALHEPLFLGNEKKYLNECIESGFVSSVGKFVDRFEESVAAYTGSRYAIAVTNGTAALHTALILSGVGRGDEVITQPLTFVATTNTISYLGAKPVFIDIDRDTLSLSPGKLEEFLSGSTYVTDEGHTVNKHTGRTIRCCVPMHTFGHAGRLDEILAVCREHNIVVIEDAAESIGSYYKGIHTGTLGHIGILSFNGNKTITSGNGGMILTADEKTARRAKHITTQAKIPHPWEYVHDETGYNYRLSNVSAAIGLAQVEQLPGFIRTKRKLAMLYKEFFENSSYSFFLEPEHSESNYWLNALLLGSREQRDKFLAFTNKNGVMTRPAWELASNLIMFRDAHKENLDNAKFIAERLVNIPSSVIKNDLD